MRRSLNKKKLYKVNKSSTRIAANVMVFLSLTIVIAGLITKAGNVGGLTVTPAATPTIMPITAAFDETMQTRDISVPEATFYALQLGAFQNEETALSLAKNYQTRGAAGYVLLDNARYRVIASVYQTREDAQLVRTQLKSSHSIDTYIYEIVLPSMDFKTSGMKGQLDVIEAVLQFFPQGIADIQKMSVVLDQKEANQTEVANEISTLVTRAQELDGLINNRFTQPRHAMVEKMGTLLKEFTLLETSLDAGTSGMTTLAGKMKYELVRLIDLTAKTYLAFME